jgi:hypothetical protein
LTDVEFAVEVTNTGSVAGKETVLVFWVPPDAVDPLLQRELFAFQGAIIEPGKSAILRFKLPAALNLSSVAENGDRYLAAGNYTVEFSRGHGVVLSSSVKLVGTTLPLRQFPSRWVDGHELTVEACVEGTTDVIPHTEPFLVEYKVWHVDGSALVHTASGLCLSWDHGNGSAPNLQTCTKAAGQAWTVSNLRVTSTQCDSGSPCCLSTLARAATDLRRNVTVGQCTSAPQSQWSLDPSSGFLHNALEGPSTAKLCLAARSVGQYNQRS